MVRTRALWMMQSQAGDCIICTVFQSSRFKVRSMPIRIELDNNLARENQNKGIAGAGRSPRIGQAYLDMGGRHASGRG
jgi:hypothetical protein